MEAWINSSAGTGETPPEGPPSVDPAENMVTPPPEPVALEASSAATPPPMEAVPTPQPLTMVSGVIESPPVATPVLATPAVTVVPVAEPVSPAAAHIAPPARQPAHAGEETAFSDQIINWMKQGDRLADPRPVEDLSLLDVAEPTDPVAHELVDSTKQRARPLTRSGRVGRWISVGVLGVAMSFGLYWAAQEPRSAAGYAVAVPAKASVAEMAPVIAPAAAPPAPAVAPAPPAAPAPATQSAAAEKATLASAAHHKHHRGAGRIHRRRTH